MKFLLDTHTLLWFIEGDAQMSRQAREIIEDSENEIAVSAATLFEIAIKLKIGKLWLRKSLLGFIDDVSRARIEVIPISTSHLHGYQALPDFPDHRDPFDRLIIATCMAENAAVISKDLHFKKYQEIVHVIW